MAFKKLSAVLATLAVLTAVQAQTPEYVALSVPGAPILSRAFVRFQGELMLRPSINDSASIEQHISRAIAKSLPLSLSQTSA